MNRSHSWLRAFVFATALAGGAIATQPIAAAPQEGIKVHGDWTIVVRNADGSIASRHEFKNALLPVGAGNLSVLLSGNLAVGTWLIYFDSSLCGRQHNDCYLSTTRYPQQGLLSSSNLVVTTGSGPDYGKLFLTGSLRAAAAGSIGQIVTMIMPCPGSVAATTCSSAGLSDFSQRLLSPAIQVVAGQTVDITVVFSFS
jgi:hypothetical protein